ncbi:CRISPR system Cascade subunit CasE [Pacificibacter marinus]|uniref:CRISPR associated protein n=1 Tax=Pacificibacter marinus TaxID=658057 RepID=A0A1Y5TUW5_9RHOB|nr:CRISPR system Cascade subunit CasE [Pacificibacter marinus]SLN70793.1 CRISPR associated protein [Pacificibacter marinus]
MSWLGLRFREIGGRGGILNGYTEKTAEQLQDMVNMAADPDSQSMIKGPILAMPIYIPKSGQSVGFEIKVVPVARNGRAKTEMDCFLHDKKNGKSVDREVSYANWLTARLAPSSDVKSIRVTQSGYYKTSRKKRPLMIPSAIFQGTMVVTDPEILYKMMVQGVGRHKAYGFGMLALRVPDRF